MGLSYFFFFAGPVTANRQAVRWKMVSRREVKFKDGGVGWGRGQTSVSALVAIVAEKIPRRLR